MEATVIIGYIGIMQKKMEATVIIGYIGIMQKKMEATIILGYIGIMEKKMEATIILGYIGIMEKKMEAIMATIMGWPCTGGHHMKLLQACCSRQPGKDFRVIGFSGPLWR